MREAGKGQQTQQTAREELKHSSSPGRKLERQANELVLVRAQKTI